MIWGVPNGSIATPVTSLCDAGMSMFFYEKSLEENSPCPRHTHPTPSVQCYAKKSHFGSAYIRWFASDLKCLPSALRELLIICDEYAREYSISFNAVKTKCLVVVPSRRRALFEELHWQ